MGSPILHPLCGCLLYLTLTCLWDDMLLKAPTQRLADTCQQPLIHPNYALRYTHRPTCRPQWWPRQITFHGEARWISAKRNTPSGQTARYLQPRRRPQISDDDLIRSHPHFGLFIHCKQTPNITNMPRSELEGTRWPSWYKDKPSISRWSLASYKNETTCETVLLLMTFG